MDVRRNSFSTPRGEAWPEGLVGKRRERAGEDALLGRKSGMLSDCPSELPSDLLLPPPPPPYVVTCAARSDQFFS